MNITAQEGAKIITDAVAAASARELTTAAADNDFCGIWPKAKPLLEVASTVLPFIPGAGAIAGPVLNGLIKIGDQIYAGTCR